MLWMALDPRTPEPEAIAALRALRKAGLTMQTLAESISSVIESQQPRSSRIKATYSYKSPFTPWSEGEPMPGSMFDDLLREIRRRKNI